MSPCGWSRSPRPAASACRPRCSSRSPASSLWGPRTSASSTSRTSPGRSMPIGSPSTAASPRLRRIPPSRSPKRARARASSWWAAPLRHLLSRPSAACSISARDRQRGTYKQPTWGRRPRPAEPRRHPSPRRRPHRPLPLRLLLHLQVRRQLQFRRQLPHRPRPPPNRRPERSILRKSRSFPTSGRGRSGTTPAPRTSRRLP